MTPRILPALVAILAGCSSSSTTDDIGGKADNPDARSCDEDGSLGDGVCDIDCATPDIDCFNVFEDADELRRFYRKTVVPVFGDLPLVRRNARVFKDVRALLDEGWAAYSSINDVGELPPPELLIIDDSDEPSSNAFVASTDGVVQWTVGITTSLIEENTEDELMSVIFHELEHGVALHVLPPVWTQIRRFYLHAPGTPEPFGFEVPIDPVLNEHGNRFVDGAIVVGGFPIEELGGLPMPSAYLGSVLTAVGESVEACEDAAFDYDGFNFMMATDTAFGELVNPLTPSALKEIETAAATVRAGFQACLAGDERDVFSLFPLIGIAAEEAPALFSQSDLVLMQGKPLIEKIFAVGDATQKRMRRASAAIEAHSGRDMSELRYYSTEEAADDAAARVMLATGRKVDALADSMLVDIAEQAQACLAAIASEAGSPYGDLADEHHSSCWRVGHTRRLAKRLTSE